MLISFLGKKNIFDILNLLSKNEELYFREIEDTLEIHKSTLSKTLKEIEEKGLISRREEATNLKIPKAYFKLTEKGKKVVKYSNMINNLDTDKDDDPKSKQEINFKNNHGIIANNIQNLNVKK
ncbi:DNA-binding HxlR family transcriptional regulator [Methanococcus maripaludis]|uniref:DNA-binding HxlR family transcriptional regulator n=1 Tax=Methanococcus maripaludis TaxID=39152 RepID=A0A7J9NL72_METMI|nr:DUF2250 domain-containing protein [Methanococcus maripaludis]MBA2846174.1 DNA-binding HxlR family transcriptional regulator [Methanococcus maripaludis]